MAASGEGAGADAVEVEAAKELAGRRTGGGLRAAGRDGLTDSSEVLIGPSGTVPDQPRLRGPRRLADGDVQAGS